MGLAHRLRYSRRVGALVAKKRLNNRITSLIGRLEKNRYASTNRMRKRLVREGKHTSTFLETGGVEYHNNRAERAIMPCVILHKNSNKSRSKKGIDTIATLMNIKQTCKVSDDDLVPVLREGLVLLQKTIVEHSISFHMNLMLPTSFDFIIFIDTNSTIRSFRITYRSRKKKA